MTDASEIQYLAADFGQNGGAVSWGTFAEVRDWITARRSDWQWVAQQSTHPTNSAWNRINDTLNNAQSHLNNAEQHKGNPQQEDSWKRNAVQQLESIFKPYWWLLPDSTYLKFIFDMRDSGRSLEAGLVTAYLMNQDFNNAPMPALLRGVVEFELFERGIKDRAKTEAAALRKLSGEMTTALDELKQLQISQGAEFDVLNQKVEDQISNHSTGFQESQATRDEEWKKRLTDAEAELKRLNDTYDTHMAIAAPVSYWETKRSNHKKWAIGSFIALSLSMLAFGIFLSFEVQGISSMVETTRSAAIAAMEKGQAKPTNTPPAALTSMLDVLASWKIGAYILLVTLVFWFIRLLVRIFLSNIHLENDAAERVTMAKTYLALMRDGSLEGKEHLGTILAALFRPTGDGIVKDEGLPPTAMEWLTKLSGKG